MTIDKEKLKALAQSVADLEDHPELEAEHAEAKDALWQHMHCHTILTLLAEIERLEFEPAKHARRLIDQLKAENEALRKDAERYQWLRQGMGKVIVVEPDNATSCDCDRYEVLLEAEVDDAVDAEIAEEAIHD